jgi:hypothetical protein
MWHAIMEILYWQVITIRCLIAGLMRLCYAFCLWTMRRISQCTEIDEKNHCDQIEESKRRTLHLVIDNEMYVPSMLHHTRFMPNASSNKYSFECLKLYNLQVMPNIVLLRVLKFMLLHLKRQPSSDKRTKGSFCLDNFAKGP